MNQIQPNLPSPLSRRQFLGTSGKAAIGGALAGMVLPHVHGQSGSTKKIALIGCGGRGTGAVANAIGASRPYCQLKLHSMADVFDWRVKQSHKGLSAKYAAQMDVPEDRQFVGFDSYKKAMDTLDAGDIAIFASPCAFRRPHYEYAIQKKLNVFMEKPVTPDGPSSKRILAANEEAKKLNLKVGVGLMCRHSEARIELKDRIDNGELGELLYLKAVRMQGRLIGWDKRKQETKDKDISDLLYQIKNFHGFLWLSGGVYSDFNIHNIDECCWMKGMWPVKAMGLGGRHYRGDEIDQNLDSYSVEYTFPDDTKLYFQGRSMNKCYQEFASHANGTKGYALISGPGGHASQARIHKGQGPKSELAWMFGTEGGGRPRREKSAYVDEWDHLLDAIVNDKPYNEVERGVAASVVTSMGRMASHVGREVTYDEMLNCSHDFCAGIDDIVDGDSPSPLLANADGSYAIPQPGQLGTEY
ncbi:MAG: twin-arginine translocation signal domain-containing protein [Verrucomicrobia bacterium]|jgi:predicted dehydrogenase|nr:twin-arginine translocation signal domain-containing protein [Verrucomicrobiota bacterium]